MDFLKLLKKQSMRKSIGWAIWPALIGLLFLLIFPIAGLICLALAVFLVAYAGLGKYQKQVLKKAQSLSPENPDALLAAAARLHAQEPMAKGLWVGSGLVFLEKGAWQWLYGSHEVCWCYLQATWHRVFYVIPVWKSYALMLRTVDGAMYELPMKKARVLDLLERLAVLLPNCVTGYSKDLEKLYFSDREQFLQLPAHQNQFHV